MCRIFQLWPEHIVILLKNIFMDERKFTSNYERLRGIFQFPAYNTYTHTEINIVNCQRCINIICLFPSILFTFNFCHALIQSIPFKDTKCINTILVLQYYWNFLLYASLFCIFFFLFLFLVDLNSNVSFASTNNTKMKWFHEIVCNSM